MSATPAPATPDRVRRALALLDAVELLDDSARVGGMTIHRSPRGATVFLFRAGSHGRVKATGATLDSAVTRAAGELVRR